MHADHPLRWTTFARRSTCQASLERTERAKPHNRGGALSTAGEAKDALQAKDTSQGRTSVDGGLLRPASHQACLRLQTEKPPEASVAVSF